MTIDQLVNILFCDDKEMFSLITNELGDNLKMKCKYKRFFHYQENTLVGEFDESEYYPRVS